MRTTRAWRARILHRKIIDNEKKSNLLRGESAQLFYEMYVNEFQKEMLGNSRGEWKEYVAEFLPFHKLGYVTNLVIVYRRLTLNLGIPIKAWCGVQSDRLVEMGTVLTSKNFEELLDKATHLSKEEWKAELKKVKQSTRRPNYRYSPEEELSTGGEKDVV